MQTGRVNENYLAILPGIDAKDAVTSGLRPGRDDADLVAQDDVDQGRLADVRPADDSDEAATKRLLIH